MIVGKVFYDVDQNVYFASVEMATEFGVVKELACIAPDREETELMFRQGAIEIGKTRLPDLARTSADAPQVPQG